MGGQTYRDLEVWQKSMDLVVEIYQLTRLFPKDEQFGLTSQIRRSVTSVPAKVAEGQGRLHKGDFLRFLSIARGFLAETENHLMVAVRLEYLDKDQARNVWSLLQEVGRLLNGLIRPLEPSQIDNRLPETLEEYDTDYRLPTTDY